MDTMFIFAKNYRGFEFLQLDLSKLHFLVGDNSSGKTSILHLVKMITDNDLNEIPAMDEEFGVGQYDYFSPYFDNDNVTFGYFEQKDGKPIGKILTVAQSRNGRPNPVACSYFTEENIITFKESNRGIRYKIVTTGQDMSLSDLIDIHHIKTGFQALDTKGHRAQVYRSELLFWLPNELEEHGFGRAAFPSSLPSTRLISPIRALPEKFYSFRRKLDVHGKHFASMWIDFSLEKHASYFSAINEFGKESGLFDSVSVEKIAKKVNESPIIVHVKKNNNKFLLHQVGIGVAQVMPILMETIYVQIQEKLVLLVQQPELHLHPVAQASLGSYFFSVARNGLSGILETHSSYFLDRFRADYRDHLLQLDDDKSDPVEGRIKILFCRNSIAGNKMVEIGVDRDGKLKDDPDEFHDFFINELSRTMF